MTGAQPSDSGTAPPAPDPVHPFVAPGVLLRYRVMAFTTAVLLIVLVFAGIPLQVAAHRATLANVVGTTHGVLYVVYLVTAFTLTRRLRVPFFPMLLVLLAGTIPFCAFVAERKMTRRFELLTGTTVGRRGEPDRAATAPGRLRRRWLSPRALLLHLEVLVVAPGCVAAGWWQATRALAGNGLSWVYSIEWPVFGLVAIWVWWHLVHEDPDAYRARKAAPDPFAATVELAAAPPRVEAVTARWATPLAVVVGFEVLLGVMGIVSIPIGRPSGWLPTKGEAVYVVHAVVGLVAMAGAVALAVRVGRLGRISRAVAWLGLACMAVASLGGLVTEAGSFVRVFGIAIMGAGSLLALLIYCIPAILGAQHRAAAKSEGAAGPARAPDTLGAG